MTFADVRRGAIVVAHPDDETLFCAGLMLRYPGRWSVICCSIPRTDPIRAWKFYDACARLGVTARVLPFVESEPGEAIKHLGVLDLAKFDCVVTHNAAGEYGHVHHIGLHGFIAERWSDRMVTIGYGVPPKPSAEVIALSDDEQSRKLAALQCYDHVSPSDGKPKWEALLDRYSPTFNLMVETYDRAGA